jgi:hypothetical protein
MITLKERRSTRYQDTRQQQTHKKKHTRDHGNCHSIAIV